MTNSPDKIPAGMFRVWDPQQKKVIFVTAPPVSAGITLTMRIHDAAEKNSVAKSSCWVSCQIDRADLTKISQADFIEKYIVPNLKQLTLVEFV